MDISSRAFSDGEEIPEKYGYRRDNVNPPLEFSEIPEEAEVLVLIVDDPDAVEPAGKIWTHWLMWNIPVETEGIGEGEKPIGAIEGKNDFGDKDYGGPNPPDKEHKYRFRLYAVNSQPELDNSAEKEDIEQEIKGQVIEEALLEGTYEPL